MMQSRYFTQSAAPATLADPRDGAGLFVATGEAEPFTTALHVHDENDEVLHLLTGAMRVTVGDEARDLAPGDGVFMPRGVPHRLAVTERSTWLVAATPGYAAEREALQAAEKQGLSGEALYDAVPGVRFVAH